MMRFLLAILATALAVPAHATIEAQGGKYSADSANLDFHHICRTAPVGAFCVSKFGRNDVVGTSEEDIWIEGGTYNWLTAADELRVKAGGNSEDTPFGVGAGTVVVQGLAADGSLAFDTLVTSGTLVGAKSTTTFSRLFRAYVAETGTYTGNNSGDILIETEAGTTVGQIEQGKGQSQLALYTVPLGYSCYLWELVITAAGGNKTTDVFLWQRRNYLDVTAPYPAKRLVHAEEDFSGSTVVPFHFTWEFPELTDIWFSAIAATSAGVTANFQLMCVQN